MSGKNSRAGTKASAAPALSAIEVAPALSAPALSAPALSAPTLDPLAAAPATPEAFVASPVPRPAVVDAAPTPEPLVEAPAAVTEVTEPAHAVITSAVEQIADLTQKEDTIMATVFEAPKPAAMLGDMNDRAKTAMAKGGKFIEEMNEFAKGNVEAVVESSRITAKGIETMGQDAAEFGRKSFEGLTATLKSLATVKSPTELFKMHSDYVRGAFDAAVAEASKSTEAMIKLASDASQPLSNRFAVAVEKAKTAA